MKAPIGKIACFVCTAECEAFREDGRKKFIYYRCRCGVVQLRTAFGQEQIKARLQLFELGTPAANEAEKKTAENAIGEHRVAVAEVKKELPSKPSPALQTIFDAMG